MHPSRIFPHLGEEVQGQFPRMHEMRIVNFLRLFAQHQNIKPTITPSFYSKTSYQKTYFKYPASHPMWSLVRNGGLIMLAFLKLFYQFQFPMQAVDKLFTNSTNRLPILPQAHFRTAFLLPALSTRTNAAPLFHSLMEHHSLLESQVCSARDELKMMEELFDSLARAERGEGKMVKRLQRRCKKDIMDRHVCPHEHCRRSYSSQASLQRHVKIKHRSGRMEPPQLYNDLPPEPNLTEQTGSEEESHTDAPLKDEEGNSEREFT